MYDKSFFNQAWLDISLVLFFRFFMDLNVVVVKKSAKKNSAKIQLSWLEVWSITHM